MIGTIGEVPEHFLVVAEHEPRLAEQAGRLGEVALVRAIDQLSKAVADIREGDEPRMTVELALLRSARPEIDPSQQALAQRLERLERRGAGPACRRAAARRPHPRRGSRRPPRPPIRSRASPLPRSRRPRRRAASPRSLRGPSPPPRRSATRARGGRRRGRGQVGATAQAATEALDLDRVAGLWPAVLDHVIQSGAGLLAAAIGDARPVAVDPDRSVVELGFPPSAAFNRRKAEVKENRDRVVEALRSVVGTTLRPVYVTLDSQQPDAADAGAEASAARRTCSSASSASSTPSS